MRNSEKPVPQGLLSSILEEKMEAKPITTTPNSTTTTTVPSAPPVTQPLVGTLPSAVTNTVPMAQPPIMSTGVPGQVPNPAGIVYPSYYGTPGFLGAYEIPLKNFKLILF